MADSDHRPSGLESETGPADRSTAGDRSRPWALLLAGTAFVLGVGVGVFAGGIAAVPFLLSGAEVTDPTVLVVTTAVQQVGFLFVGYGFARWVLGGLPVATPSADRLRWVGGATLAALVLAGLLNVVGGYVGVDEVQSVLEASVARDPTVLLVLAVLSVLVVAPAEEVLFRGAVQGTLREGFSAPVAVVLASLAFTSIHLFNYLGGLSTGVLAILGIIFAVSLILGFAYERTDNLAVPILVHGSYNAALFVISFVSLAP